jgi:hypothetical protein
MNHFSKPTDIERAALLYTYKEINEKFLISKLFLPTTLTVLRISDSLITSSTYLTFRFSTLPLQLDDILESNLLSNSTSLT